MIKRLSALVLCLAAALCASARDVNPTLSPDGTMLAFTRDNDLWVRCVADSSETRLTFDGTERIMNGYASWVYYEEILGRGSNYRAFWWSPDSRRIGFYRFDNTDVPVFPIYHPSGQYGSLSLTAYPKAGSDNPEVSIGICDLAEGRTVWADFERGREQYFGIPFWGDDSREFYISREPRRQNTLDLYAVSAADGSKRHIYHEEYPTWLEWISGMLFTDKGLYMARSFETGWQQIYFLGYDGTLKRLTDGSNWDIRLLRADSSSGEVLFSAKRDSRLHTSLYRLSAKGGITCLTDPDLDVTGIRISDDGKSFRAMASNARTPYREIEGRTDRRRVVTVCDTVRVEPGSRPVPQIVSIENGGYVLYGLMSVPRGFDSRKKYPVVMQLYGGPGTPYVRDRWNDRDASDQWCYDNGIIYIVVDPRSSGENGRRGMDEAFLRMTVTELQDYIAWAEWLKSLPYVEGSRIGVEGFSFGGTTTAMLVLRYPEHFCCGVAGGGVYDWRLYDSHYTERFMDTPQANPEGYAEASVLTYIPGLRNPGALKITHGTGDDNVHFQNTLQLIDALQKENIPFELMIYPDGMHGYRGYQHIHDRDDDHRFWSRHLLGK